MNIKDLTCVTRINSLESTFATFTQKQGGRELSGIVDSDFNVVAGPMPGFFYEGDGRIFQYLDEDGSNRLYDACRQQFLPGDTVFLGLEGQAVYRKGEHLGIRSLDTLCAICPPDYRQVRTFRHLNMYALQDESGHWGVVDRHLNVLIPFSFDRLEPQNVWMRGHLAEFVVAVGDCWQMIDLCGKKLTTGDYEWLSCFTPKGYALCKLHGRICVIDRAEEVVLRTDFCSAEDADGDLIRWISPDCLCFRGENGRYGIMTALGKVICPASQTNLMRINLTDRFCIAVPGGRKGLIDGEGRWIIEPDYDSLAYKWRHKCCVVSREGRYGLIDLDGKVLLPLEYDFISVPMSHDLGGLSAGRGGRICFYDSCLREEEHMRYEDKTFPDGRN